MLLHVGAGKETTPHIHDIPMIYDDNVFASGAGVSSYTFESHGLQKWLQNGTNMVAVWSPETHSFILHQIQVNTSPPNILTLNIKN